MDLDINLLSPKIIIHETLLHDKIMNVNEVATVIIDLGSIEAKTNLIKKERNYDYTKCNDPVKLYESTIVKFGKLKVIVDYKLKLSNKPVSEKQINWEVSKDKVDVTNEFSFGFELKSCFIPFH